MANMELDNVINKIRHLCNKTVDRGATEGEAMAAAEKVAELMKIYNLTVDKVFLDKQNCVLGEVSLGQKRRPPVSSVATAIAEFCDVKVWMDACPHWREGHSSIKFFGLETDVEMAKYLYGMIDAACDTATAEFKRSETYLNGFSHRKTMTTSFQFGFANRVSVRLREMSNKRQREEAAVPIGALETTSIVLIKHDKVESEFEKLGIRLRSHTRHHRSHDFHASSAGREAGDRVNLNRPMGAAGPKGYLQ